MHLDGFDSMGEVRNFVQARRVGKTLLPSASVAKAEKLGRSIEGRGISPVDAEIALDGRGCTTERDEPISAMPYDQCSLDSAGRVRDCVSGMDYLNSHPEILPQSTFKDYNEGQD